MVLHGVDLQLPYSPVSACSTNKHIEAIASSQDPNGAHQPFTFVMEIIYSAAPRAMTESSSPHYTRKFLCPLVDGGSPFQGRVLGEVDGGSRDLLSGMILDQVTQSASPNLNSGGQRAHPWSSTMLSTMTVTL